MREWIEGHVGPVSRVRRLRGATSALLDAVDAGGQKYVLKRYVNREWLAREPDLAARESAALELLRDTDVPAPVLVALHGDALLMTRLPGQHHWNPPSIERLAELAPVVHEVRAPRGFRPYRRYVRPGAEPPPWTSRRAMWERAIAVADAAVARDACFIHRDHHAGNVLWWRGRVSGIVDWVEACVGPRAVDAARVRLNLLWEVGEDAADAYARCPGVVVDPVWDVVDAIDSALAADAGTRHAAATEDFIARALAALG